MHRFAPFFAAALLSGCASHSFPIETPREEAIVVPLDVCADSDTAFEVLGAEIHDRTLYVEIQDPGDWCGGTFSACMDDAVLLSDPPQQRLLLRYVNGTERCASVPHRRLLSVALEGDHRVSLLGDRSVVLF